MYIMYLLDISIYIYLYISSRHAPNRMLHDVLSCGYRPCKSKYLDSPSALVLRNQYWRGQEHSPLWRGGKNTATVTPYVS
jgi:hypothetical protein